MAEHHPLGDIEYLRENFLKHYKRGFPILKELVQNAEDAQATRLDYGWIKGLSNAQHPLLKSPAIFLLDNGDFTQENAKAIRYILGGSSKPNQQDSIGKFGLGLKSVFHLCEAFFYVAPTVENPRYKTSDLFNPWAGAENKDDYHENWDNDNFSNTDVDYIKESLQLILKTKAYQEKWFILWIPLRQNNHKTKKNEEDGIELGCIKNDEDDFFDAQAPDFLSDEDTQEKLSFLLPLLSNVKEISYWQENFKKPQFTIKLQQGNQRYPKFSEVKEPNKIEGKISIVAPNNNDTSIVDFAGFEAILDCQKLKEIQNDPKLPTKFKHIKPHYAIIFNQLNNKSSQLILQTAVFLPVGEDHAKKCQTEKSYYITLHGYFFVDCTRTSIVGWDNKKWSINPEKLKDEDSVDALKKQWNYNLYQGLLSQFLESLDKACSKFNISQKEITAICQALCDFCKGKDWQNIYQKYQYIYIVYPDKLDKTDKNKTGWKLLDSNQKILCLPEVPPDWAAFPKLSDLGDICFTLEGKPNLCPTNKPEQWSEEEITSVIESLNPQTIFAKKENISYLEKFLKHSKQHEQKSVQKSLTEFVKKGLSLPDVKYSTEEIQIRSLISLINKEQRFAVKCDKCEPNILKEIYQLDLQVLIIYETLDPTDNPSSKTLNSDNDAILIINCLVKLLNSKSDLTEKQSIYKLIKDILKSAKKDHIPKIISQCHGLPIYGKNLQTKEQKFYKFQEEINGKNYVFVESKFGCDQLAEFLQKALADQEIILVDQEIINILKSQINVDVASRENCLKLLTPEVKLSEPSCRKNLLKELLKNV